MSQDPTEDERLAAAVLEQTIYMPHFRAKLLEVVTAIVKEAIQRRDDFYSGAYLVDGELVEMVFEPYPGTGGGLLVKATCIHGSFDIAVEP